MKLLNNVISFYRGPTLFNQRIYIMFKDVINFVLLFQAWDIVIYSYMTVEALEKLKPEFLMLKIHT